MEKLRKRINNLKNINTEEKLKEMIRGNRTGIAFHDGVDAGLNLIICEIAKINKEEQISEI